MGGRYPDYFPHIPGTVDGAVRLQLEFKAEEAIGRDQRFKIRAMSDSELLELVGFSNDAEGLARFTWKYQQWIVLLCKNLGVKDVNHGEYSRAEIDKPFIEGVPIYFPLYVKLYDDIFRGDPERAAGCNYELSKPAATLVWDWWYSDKSRRFRSLRGRWLIANAAWLGEHSDPNFDADKVLTELGFDVSRLPQFTTEELEALLNYER